MYNLIDFYWRQRVLELEKALPKAQDEQDEIYRRRQIDWMKTTRMAVVVSEEQGEMEKFRKWALDITPHRQLIKQGFETEDGKRIDIDLAFKKNTLFASLSSAPCGLQVLMSPALPHCILISLLRHIH